MKLFGVDLFGGKAKASSFVQAPVQSTIFDGDKFLGGFGATEFQWPDYWTLRQRSAQLFNENLYARGVVRRLITNEINTGLTPGATPDENVLGLPDDSLNDWTEDVESRFGIWAKSPLVCDWRQLNTFGALQRAARLEALVTGDVLVILRQSPRTRMPTVQLVGGDKVQTPLASDNGPPNSHTIQDGVEFNSVGRIVAYWVLQDDGTSKRVMAFGEKSGRRVAWLIYGTDKRWGVVRGQPLLAIMLQSLKEIDRYRDSTQRKAVLNSILALFIKKTEDKPGTLPISNGAVRRDQGSVTDGDGTIRKFNLAAQIPGLVMEELQTGEEPVAFGNEGIDVQFGSFEASIVRAMAWSLEIPPEVLELSFNKNYSASQAAINEFNMYLHRTRNDFGETFCSPIYNDWLLSEVLLQRLQAPGLLESWRDPMRYETFGAWVSTEWYGSIKPSTDMLKQGKGSKIFVEEGWTTNSRESRMLTGTKFSQNIKRLKRENELKVEAMRPLAEFRAQFGEEVVNNLEDSLEDVISASDDVVVPIVRSERSG